MPAALGGAVRDGRAVVDGSAMPRYEGRPAIVAALADDSLVMSAEAGSAADSRATGLLADGRMQEALLDAAPVICCLQRSEAPFGPAEPTSGPLAVGGFRLVASDAAAEERRARPLGSGRAGPAGAAGSWGLRRRGRPHERPGRADPRSAPWRPRAAAARPSRTASGSVRAGASASSSWAAKDYAGAD